MRTRKMAAAEVRDNLGALRDEVRDAFGRMDATMQGIRNRDRRALYDRDVFDSKFDDFPRWLRRIETTMEELGYEGGPMRKLFLIRNLGPEAKAAAYIIDQNDNLPYADLVAGLRLRFAQQTGTLSQKRSFETIFQRDDETIETFADRLKRTVNQAYPDLGEALREELAVGKFIVTLKPTFLRERLCLENINTVYQAVRRAKELIEARKVGQSDIQVNSIAEEGMLHMMRLIDKVDQLIAAQKPERTSQPLLKCNVCMKAGHLPSQCRMLQNGKRIQCYNCGKNGHKANQCRAPNYRNNFNNFRPNFQPYSAYQARPQQPQFFNQQPRQGNGFPGATGHAAGTQ